MKEVDALDAGELGRERQDRRDEARLLVREAVVLLPVVEESTKGRRGWRERERAREEERERGREEKREGAEERVSMCSRQDSEGERNDVPGPS